jgi:hypothetical protein
MRIRIHLTKNSDSCGLEIQIRPPQPCPEVTLDSAAHAIVCIFILVSELWVCTAGQYFFFELFSRKQL